MQLPQHFSSKDRWNNHPRAPKDAILFTGQLISSIVAGRDGLIRTPCWPTRHHKVMHLTKYRIYKGRF